MSKEMWNRLCEEKQRQWDEMLASMTDKEREHFLDGYDKTMRSTNLSCGDFEMMQDLKAAEAEGKLAMRCMEKFG